MAAGSIYKAVKEAMQDLVAPQVASINGAIAGLQGEVKGLRGEMDGLRAEMNAQINGLRGELKGEIAAARADLRTVDERLTIALDLRERIVAIEAKLGS